MPNCSTPVDRELSIEPAQRYWTSGGAINVRLEAILLTPALVLRAFDQALSRNGRQFSGRYTRMKHVIRSAATCGLSVALVAVLAAQPPPPDNTKVNARDREAAAKTADQQGNTKADVEMTRKIRQAIMEDKTLSTYAHNVKMITRAGKVTLKGPVKTAEEKKTVEAKAAEVAGASNVKSQVSVAQPSAKSTATKRTDKQWLEKIRQSSDLSELWRGRERGNGAEVARLSNPRTSRCFPENAGTKDFAHEKGTKAPEGATTGAARVRCRRHAGVARRNWALAIPGLGPSSRPDRSWRRWQAQVSEERSAASPARSLAWAFPNTKPSATKAA